MRPRDFFAYQWAVHKRAGLDTWRLALKHIRAEIAVALAATLATGILAGDPALALMGGVLTGIILFAVYYIAYLCLAPARLHVEQESELSKYVSVQAPRSYRGLLDYAYDFERGVSLKSFLKHQDALTKEVAQITAKLQRAKVETEKESSLRKKRRVAIRLGKYLQSRARRMRRIHTRYKRAIEGLAEMFHATGPAFVQAVSPDEATGAVDSLRRLRDATKSNAQVVAQARQLFLSSLGDKQEQLAIACEQLDFVMTDIEKTAAKAAQSFDRTLKEMTRQAQSPKPGASA